MKFTINKTNNVRKAFTDEGKPVAVFGVASDLLKADILLEVKRGCENKIVVIKYPDYSIVDSDTIEQAKAFLKGDAKQYRKARHKMNNQTTEQLKRIAAKQTLGLPLTSREVALWTLYGTFETVAKPLVDLAEFESDDVKPSETTQKTAFVHNYLSPLLRAARLNIENAKYTACPKTREETITVTYTNGFTRDICVTADSLRAIITDVMSKV